MAHYTLGTLKSKNTYQSTRSTIHEFKQDAVDNTALMTSMCESWWFETNILKYLPYWDRFISGFLVVSTSTTGAREALTITPMRSSKSLIYVTETRE